MTLKVRDGYGTTAFLKSRTKKGLVSNEQEHVISVEQDTDNLAWDSFNRMRMSSPVNRFDIEFIYDKQPELVDEVSVGGGTGTHNPNPGDVTLAVGDATNGSEEALYSHIDVPYTPGNSQLAEVTGTLDDADIGGGDTFIVVRSSISGSPVEDIYQYGVDWDTVGDPFDWATSQLFGIDFQSLKVGRIRTFFSRKGLGEIEVTINNDNVRSTGFWQRPSLPVFWRIHNDATYTHMEMGYGDETNAIFLRYRIPVNASATMRAICATVKSEGGPSIADLPGLVRAISNRLVPVTVSTTEIPILSIRVAATFKGITNRGLYIPTNFSLKTDNPIFYKLVYRPALTGAVWASVDATNSGIEYDVSATAFTGGVILDEDFATSERNKPEQTSGSLSRAAMALGRTGTSDILTIVAVRTSVSNASVQGDIKWKEIR